jgi:hypothetical protein
MFVYDIEINMNNSNGKPIYYFQTKSINLKISLIIDFWVFVKYMYNFAPWSFMDVTLLITYFIEHFQVIEHGSN